MMCNIWIFDVGRGLSVVINTPSNKWIVIDLGSDENFCPVNNFLIKHIPLKKGDKDERRNISQLIISHPHDDHMTAIEAFDKKFYPSLLTVPNDNDRQEDASKVNWELVEKTNTSSRLTNYLRNNMLKNRTPPLRATTDDNVDGFVFKIYYLKPGVCESHKNLQLCNYTNNLSIIARLNYKGNVVLFCGDMMKDGMDLLVNIRTLRARL